MTAQFDCQNSNNSLSYQVNVIVFSESLIVSGRLGNGRWSVLTQTIPPPDRACPHLQLGKFNNSSSDSLLSHSSRPLPPSPHNLLTPLSTVTLLLAWTLSPGLFRCNISSSIRSSWSWSKTTSFFVSQQQLHKIMMRLNSSCQIDKK